MVENKKNTKRCICKWPLCDQWSSILSESSEYCHIAGLAEIRSPARYRTSKTTNTNTRSKKNKKAVTSTLDSHHEKYRSAIFHHLGITRLEQSKFPKDIYIAKHHFPHKYLLEKKRVYYRRPISGELASDLGINRDKTNFAKNDIKSNKKLYYFVPNVPMKDVEGIILGLNSGRLSRQVKRVSEDPPVPIATSPKVSKPNLTRRFHRNDIEDILHVSDYIPTVEFLTARLQILIEAAVKKVTVEKGKVWKTILNEYLNNNLHFKQLSMLIYDFYGKSNDFSFKSSSLQRKIHIQVCQEQSSKRCSKVTVSKSFCCENRCSFCQLEIFNTGKKRKREVENANKWSDPSSRANVTNLSPSILAKRLKRTRQRSYKLKQQLNKALKLEDQIYLEAHNDAVSDVIKFISNAKDISPENYTKYRQVFIDSLLGELERNVNEEKMADVTDFVDETLNKILNFRKVLDEKPNSVRFSPREIRMAITMYNLSPSGYREVKNSSLNIMPSISQNIFVHNITPCRSRTSYIRIISPLLGQYGTYL